MSSYARQLMNCVEIGKAVTSAANMEQITTVILKRISELIQASNWTLYLLDHERGELTFALVMGLDRDLIKDHRIRLGEGIAGRVALTGEPIFVRDRVNRDPRFNPHIDALTGFKTESVICVPLKVHDRVIGVLEVINPQDTSLFEDDFQPILSILADFTAIGIVNARVYEEINRLVITDDVTGCYNTRFMHDYLARAIGDGREVSLVFLDLDDFKAVVDRHGHQLGSKMLKEVAATLVAGMDPQDRLIHYGGDEFVIILPEQDKTAAFVKVKRIRETFGNTVFLREEGLDIGISASFGIASYPQDAPDQKGLLQLADNALYSSKDRGKNTITVL
ncbi:MAG: sensor domain-containing diguanylate cyclase [Thermodesulfobacteriota bacterium]